MSLIKNLKEALKIEILEPPVMPEIGKLEEFPKEWKEEYLKSKEVKKQ